MKETRWLSEFSSLSEYTRLYPSCGQIVEMYGRVVFYLMKVLSLAVNHHDGDRFEFL